MSCPQLAPIVPLIIGLAPAIVVIGILMWVVIRATLRLMP